MDAGGPDSHWNWRPRAGVLPVRCSLTTSIPAVIAQVENTRVSRSRWRGTRAIAGLAIAFWLISGVLVLPRHMPSQFMTDATSGRISAWALFTHPPDLWVSFTPFGVAVIQPWQDSKQPSSLTWADASGTRRMLAVSEVPHVPGPDGTTSFDEALVRWMSSLAPYDSMYVYMARLQTLLSLIVYGVALRVLAWGRRRSANDIVARVGIVMLPFAIGILWLTLRPHQGELRGRLARMSTFGPPLATALSYLLLHLLNGSLMSP